MSYTLSSYSYPLQGLQLLLIAYKYSLIYNGYSIAFEENMKEKTLAWKLLNTQLTPKIVQDYIFSADLEVQSQMGQLIQLHEQPKQDLENFISVFFKQKNQQFAEFQKLINTLFNEKSSYWIFLSSMEEFQKQYFRNRSITPPTTIQQNS